MKKAYAVADFLSEGNKLLMKKTAEECGFEICFFENNKEAAGKVYSQKRAHGAVLFRIFQDHE